MKDAPAFTKKAPKKTFAKVVKKSGDAGKAVRIANSAVKKAAPASRVIAAMKAKRTKQVRGE